MAQKVARVGAAAFALGLSLAGPPGVAAADNTDGDAPAVAATAGAAQQKAGAARGPRAGRTARAAAATVGGGAADRNPAGRSPAPVVEPTKATGTARRQALPDSVFRLPARAAATVAAATSGAPSSAAAPVTSAPPAGPAAAGATIGEAPATAPTGTCSGCSAFRAKTGAISAGRPLATSLRAAELLDGISHWLSGLPSSPVSTFLTGALQLVRRNLFADVPIVHVSDVTVSETSPGAVFTVTLDKAYTSPLTVGYATASALNHPGTEQADLAARATAGADYQAASGILTFAPGQTSQQVTVACLDDHTAEESESFTLEILAVTGPKSTSPPAGAATSSPSAARVAADSTESSSVVLASGTATIVDDECVRIDVNPNFAYSDALLASVFSNLAYNHRDAAAFSQEVQATGWQGIGVADASLGANAYSPAAGGYGVQDGWSIQSYAFAGKRTAADGTVQFVVSFEGSNSPLSEPADWINNAGQYGWSNYYASLEPLMTEVVGQMLQAQADQQKTQLILTGHSLGGAASMMAFADLLAPQGNLWPNTSSVLAAGQRVLDTVGGWTPEVRTALLAATSVYTFGAPSILIEPTKPGIPDVAAFVTKLSTSGFWGALTVLADAVGGLTVDDNKLPDLTGIAGINFGTRVFQFEHANTSWWPPYPGDIVAQIGSRDPGTVLAVNLDNGIQTAYAGSKWLSLVPGITHPISLYRESIARLITNSKLLKNPNDLGANTPQLTQTAAGQGSDTRNDFFVNLSDSGLGGNDLFAFTKAGTYTADGGVGTDAYSISGYGITLTIDGSLQSGRDTLVFNVAGTPGAQYTGTGNDTAVFAVTGADGQSSSVTVTHWDQWQISDAFQVISPADGSWTLTNLTIDGPVVVTPVDEVPISVV